MADIIPYSELDSVQFYVLGNKDNAIDAQVEVKDPDIYNNGLAAPNGVYSARMGAVGHDWKCDTCKNTSFYCPGHYGMIKLNYPVVSPMFIKEIIKWLKIICFSCGQLIIPYEKLRIREDKILNEYVRLTRASNKNLTCSVCNAPHPHIERDTGDSFSLKMSFYEASAVSTSKAAEIPATPLYPHQIANIFSRITADTVRLMGKNPELCHPRKYILNVLRVPPNTIRPEIKKMTGGRSSSNDITILLQNIVKVNSQIQVKDYGREDVSTDLAAQIHNLNLAVFDMIKGSSSPGKRTIVNNSRKPLTSLAKRIPRKTGRVRRNIMGRRVDHMARGFITCDTNLRMDEIGVPIRVARDIQVPEIVREYNYERLQTYFLNGINRYPGCTKVTKASTGKTHYVGHVKSDFKLEIGDTIFRDIVTGDYVAINRQPSLEPSGITTVKVIIMEEGDSIRLNVCICGLFNADFDGDAMNILFSLYTITTNEIRELSGTAQFFISYKKSSPAVGSKHDSTYACAELTLNSTKLDKAHAMQLFGQINTYPDFSGIKGIIGGRDVFTMLLQSTGNFINYARGANFYDENYAPYRKYDPADIKVEIVRGKVKSGVIDHRAIGATNGSIFHIIAKQYSPEAALEAVFNVQQLALAFLYCRGNTVTISDILLREECLKAVYRIEDGLQMESRRRNDELNHGRLVPPVGTTLEEYFESRQMDALNPADAYWEYIFRGTDALHNHIYKMIAYGARGEMFNFKNISAAIGQITINGERMLELFGGRTLPYFTKYDPDPASRGNIANSYSGGLTCAEMCFHAQDARYAIINKGLSTSITGTYNRMAIKNLEAMVVDIQRRLVVNGNIVQFLYGGEGSDARHLEKVKFPTMDAGLTHATFEEKYHVKAATALPKDFQGAEVQKLLDEEFEQLRVDRAYFVDNMVRSSLITGGVYETELLMPVNLGRIIDDTLYNLEADQFPSDHDAKQRGAASEIRPKGERAANEPKASESEPKASESELDPVQAVKTIREYCRDFGYALLNEDQRKLQSKIPDYFVYNTCMMLIYLRGYLNVASLLKRKINNDVLQLILDHVTARYTKSLVGYGTAMGIIAAQAISEPMTQGVLNAHHTSGVSSIKKTGMFRVKEILTARPTDKMLSPSMSFQLWPEYSRNKARNQEVANHIEMLQLRDFVRSWQLFYEPYGKPIHPLYAKEEAMIKEFEKYNIHLKPPSDLANWCIRLSLDKFKLIEKQLRMDTVYQQLRKHFPLTYIVYTGDNAANLVMRIYIRAVGLKKAQTVTKMGELVNTMLDLVIRGIRGIRAAFVKEGAVSVEKEGAVVDERQFYIFTVGTAMAEVMKNPYVNPYTVQSDSIMEVYETLGIAAAYGKIINELKLQIPGSSHRHYTVYAAMMTSTGTVTPIDRYGSTKRGSSVYQRVSDSSPLTVIEEAAINCLSDDLSGVSPPLMVGKNPEIGDLYSSFRVDEAFVAQERARMGSVLEAL